MEQFQEPNMLRYCLNVNAKADFAIEHVGLEDLAPQLIFVLIGSKSTTFSSRWWSLCRVNPPHSWIKSVEKEANMAERPPGPLCTTQVGSEWIDQGTGCRSRTAPPGPAGVSKSSSPELPQQEPGFLESLRR